MRGIDPTGGGALDDLLAEVVARGAELLPWQVLADRLDELGRPEQAEVTRLRCELIRTCLEPQAHPGRSAWQKRMVDLLCGGVEPCVPRHTVDLGGVGMGFVWVPPGAFLMGSPDDEDGRLDDEALHEVTLTRGLWLGATAVTWAQFRSVAGEDPSTFNNDDRPVERVSWDDAVGFAGALSRRADSGHTFRLPTEAEWEWACRAGTTTRYWSGDGDDDLARVGWYANSSGDETRPVGSKRAASPFGLHDVHGNVWEWCADWYGDYPRGPITDPAGPSQGSDRVIRGGSWDNAARSCRSADRDRSVPAIRSGNLGFRLALFPPSGR